MSSARLRRGARFGTSRAIAFLAFALGLAVAPSAAQALCGSVGERACCVAENGFPFGGCNASAVTVPWPNAGLCSGFNPFGIQASAICVAPTPCGNSSQRACCVGENGFAFGGCFNGLNQVPQANSGYCTNSSLGVQSSGVCVPITPCGANGQRACCALEAAFGACQSGLVQLPQPNSGQCSNWLPGVQSSGVCAVPTPCGGTNQRACCVGENGFAFGGCLNGLNAVPQANSGQCSNLAPGIQSSSMCVPITPCGANGQRACCALEAAFGACQSGLVQLPQPNSGQCSNWLPGVQSSGVCAVPTPCGGTNQRACCVGENGFAFGGCGGGLNAVPQANSGQCSNLAPGIQSSSMCVPVTACGGNGQRACCTGENGFPFGGCSAGFNQVPQPNSGQCSNLLPGIQSSGMCVPITACGGDGQRACCTGENGFPFGGCIAPFAQLPQPNSGQCSNLLPGIQSSGVCAAVTPCGGEGERGCCVAENGYPFGGCNYPLTQLPLPNAGQCGNSLPGIQSSGVCAPKLPCGGIGQRACCFGSETVFEPCQPGLTEVPGCSGDCTCGDRFSSSSSSSMCAVMAPIAEPTPNWTPPASGPATPLRGFADLHVHLFGHMAHGGGVLAGTPYDPKLGVNEALKQDYGTDLDLVARDGSEMAPPTCPTFLGPDCGRVFFHGDHLILAPNSGGSDQAGAGTKDGGDRFALGADSNLGAPIFSSWPTWTTTTHQQAYHTWLERAWRGGLRLMVMLAVNNQALCETSKRLRGTDCSNGMAQIDAQLAEAHRFQKFIDQLAGGDGQGWFRIVTSPAEARGAIERGKLAVVLGIEVDNLFDCKLDERDPTTGRCTDASVRGWVNQYYAQGVRHIFPIHNFENAFGAPATWMNEIHVANRGIEGSWWQAEDCPGEEYGFKLNADPFTLFMTWIMSMFGFGVNDIPAPHAGDASCNAIGLSPLGAALIDQMIQRGMIIDIDHMSSRALDETLALAERVQPPYPVVASHVQFFELNQEPIRHERMRTRQQLRRIRNDGGMIAAMLKDDRQDTDDIGKKFNLPYGSISDDCRHSSKTWAQAYRFAVDTMQGPVAFGSDFNGAAGHVGPRFGSDGCGGEPGLLAPERNARLQERVDQLRAGNRLQYPFTIPGFGTFDRQQTGQKTFDFNFDGLAHIGLLPDLVADLQQVGLGGSDLDPLFRSAEAYVQLWDRATEASACPRPSGIDSDGDGIDNACDNCPWASNADQADSGGVGVSAASDGIGDACQCGDATGDGQVTLADAIVIQRSLLLPPTATQPRPQLCDVGGNAGCSIADAVIIRRALLVPPTAAITPVCAPAHP